MAMLKSTYDILVGKLGDVMIKVDDKDVKILDVIDQWHDAAEAKDKVQKANKEISDERDLLKKAVADAKKVETDLAAELERHRKNSLTDEDKAKLEAMKKKGMLPEMEAQFNAAIEKINTLTKSHEDLVSQITAEKTAVITARKESAEKDLRVSLTDALAKANIRKSARLAVNTILSEGMAKIVEENGAFRQVFTVMKDGKPLALTSVDEVATHVAKEYEQLVDSSGNGGTGHQHNGNGGAGDETDYNKMSPGEAQRRAAEGLYK
jgi:hypothetical protein